jgi:Skp family chaperone for outer membrane proteins
MKKIIAGICVAGAMAVTAGTKIAVVNLETLVKNHPSHESNRALVKTTAEDYRKKMEAKQEQLKKLVEEGKKLQSDWQNPILSAAGKSELQKKMETIQQKLFAGQQEMRADDQHYQNELADLQQRLFKIEKTEVEKQIREYAKAEGFDLVVDAAACGFAASKLDVTDAILKKMGVDPKKNK